MGQFLTLSQIRFLHRNSKRAKSSFLSIQFFSTNQCNTKLITSTGHSSWHLLAINNAMFDYDVPSPETMLIGRGLGGN